MSSKVVSVHDDAGCIQFYSRGFLNLLGYEAKDVIGQALINLVHPRSKRAARAGVDRMRRHESTFDAWTFQFVTASGDAVWLDGLASNFLRDPRLGGIMVYWTPRPTGSGAPSR
jgi:PAS domain S-box-containing protein